MTSSASFETKIWIEIQRKYDENHPNNQPLKEVRFEKDASPSDIIAAIHLKFKIKENDLNYKLRNHRGSLIIISNKLRSNSKSVPYVLEVTKLHQHVQALPKAANISDHHGAVKKTLQTLDDRLSKLEFEVPNLKNNRNKRITQEMEEMEKTMAFLNTRLEESREPRWKGMFNKHPLW